MRYYLFVLVLLQFYCCKEKEIHENVLLLKDFKEVEFIGFNDKTFFDTCYIVPLETTSESLIGEISDLQVFNEKVFVLDKRQNIIFVFDRKGNSLYKIDKVGRGPEEYLHISGFFVDKTDSTINILEPLNLFIAKYNLRGEFINKVYHNNKNYTFVKSIKQIDKENLICYFKLGFHDNIMYGIVNKNNFSDIKAIHTYPFKLNQMSFALYEHPFCVNEDGIKLTYPFSNTIYNYTKNSFLSIENGKENISNNLLKNKFLNTDSDCVDAMLELTKENKYNVGFNNYFENSRFILFDQEKLNLEQYRGYIWDKSSNKGYKIENYIGSKPHLSQFNFTDENSIIRIWNNNSIRSFIKHHIDNPDYAMFKTLLQDYDVDNDNPILLFYTFKNE